MLISWFSDLFRNKGCSQVVSPHPLPITYLTPLERCAIKEVRNAPTLFYDIDGVFHAYQNDSLSQQHLLVDLIAAYGDVQLVMSSNWRESMTYGFFAENFHPIILDRTIGFTPVFDLEQASRSAEVEAFAAHYGIDNFICIDDTSNLFYQNCNYLYLTEKSTGITRQDIDKIKIKLGSILTS